MPDAILSPCNGICALDDVGRCLGCLRTTDEIAGWARMNHEQRQRLMQEALPARALETGALAAALPDCEHLLRALRRPLTAAPPDRGWNHDDLADLLPPETPTEAAVLAGLVPRPQGVQVLLTRRTDQLRTHGGQVSFPGGRIERGDRGPVMAALRESNEEIALPPGKVQALGYLDPFTTISNYRVTPVVAVIDPAFVAVPQPAEVAEVFEVPLDFLMNPDNLRQIQVELRGRTRRVFEYTWPGQRIWGATAAILYNLRCRLEHTA